jgi:glycosyltransferase involved in cell wall biosynthesis
VVDADLGLLGRDPAAPPARRLHVLVVTVVHRHDDARILYREIAAIVAAGHRVTYVAPWPEDAEAPAGVTVVPVPRATGRNRVHALRAARRQVKQLRDAVDLLLFHDPELVVAFAAMRRPPTVFDVHEATADTLVDKPWLPAWARRPLRAVVGWSERYAEARMHLVLADAGYASRFRRPHPVVANETAVPDDVPPPGDERVVYVGRLSTGRGARTLLELAPLLPKGVRLELIGPADADVAPALEAARDAGVLDWQGFVPNDVALQRCEGALAGVNLVRPLPNYTNSRQTKVYEYMSRGIPVIATPVPVAVETIERFDCGIVVPFDDAPAVADAVRRLRDDAARRVELGANGHKAALASFDWRVTSRDFVAALESWARA